VIWRGRLKPDIDEKYMCQGFLTWPPKQAVAQVRVAEEAHPVTIQLADAPHVAGWRTHGNAFGSELDRLVSVGRGKAQDPAADLAAGHRLTESSRQVEEK
jgi:hypothetical protein